MGQLKLTTASGGSVILNPTNTASDYTISVPAVTGTMLTNKTAGTVLQVVNATYSTQVTTTSSSFVTTGLSASITPTSSTSKILVLVSMPLSNSTGNEGAKLTIYRNGSNIAPNTGLGSLQATGTIYSGLAIHLLDSPSTTSSTTYTVYGSATGGITVTFNSLLTGATSSVITLMEIAA